MKFYTKIKITYHKHSYYKPSLYCTILQLKIRNSKPDRKIWHHSKHSILKKIHLILLHSCINFSSVNVNRTEHTAYKSYTEKEKAGLKSMFSSRLHLFWNNRIDSIPFLFGRWMVLLKVETKLLALPRTMHQCKIKHGNTTGVKSVVLTTPKHHKLLE